MKALGKASRKPYKIRGMTERQRRWIVLGVLALVGVALGLIGNFAYRDKPQPASVVSQPKQVITQAQPSQLDIEKAAAWDEGTRLLEGKLWNLDYAEWHKIPDRVGVSSVVCFGPAHGGEAYWIGGFVRAKNAFGEWVINPFDATLIRYSEDDWMLLDWEFEDINLDHLP